MNHGWCAGLGIVSFRVPRKRSASFVFLGEVTVCNNVFGSRVLETIFGINLPLAFLQSHTVTSSTAPHRNQVEDAPCANQGEAVSLFTPLQQLHEPRRHSLSPLIILLVGRLADDDDDNNSSSSNDIQQQQRPPFAITGRVVTLLCCTGARGLKGERPQLVLSGAPSALKLKLGKPQRTANTTTNSTTTPSRGYIQRGSDANAK